MRMTKTAFQNKGFSLAGLLSNVSVQDSAKYFAQYLAKLSLNLSKPDIENLIKPNVHKCAVSGDQDFMVVTTRAAEGFITVTTRTGEDLLGVISRAGEDFIEVTTRGGKIYAVSQREGGSLCNSTRPRARASRSNLSPLSLIHI